MQCLHLGCVFKAVRHEPGARAPTRRCGDSAWRALMTCQPARAGVGPTVPPRKASWEFKIISACLFLHVIHAHVIYT